MPIIYHLARAHAWEEAERTETYEGTPEDRADGFIHFSTAGQVAESAARHRAGEPDLVLIACDADALGDALKWEPARGGAVFPHLYGDVPRAACLWAQPLKLGPDGLHIFPDLN